MALAGPLRALPMNRVCLPTQEVVHMRTLGQLCWWNEASQGPPEYKMSSAGKDAIAQDSFNCFLFFCSLYKVPRLNTRI